MEWDVLLDEEFADWLDDQEEGLQDAIFPLIGLLRRFGPNLSRPRVDTVKGSRYGNMKELRVQYQGDPWRILFAFDPTRCAILLIGGNKRGNGRWYHEHIRIADERFARHLKSLR
jgi:hypothetical protein